MAKTFGEFSFDDRRRLFMRGRPVRLAGQAVDVLALLVERPGELVTRDEIRRRLWPDSNVEFDHSVDVVVSRLRAVLGDSGKSPRYIETVPRRGYRFVEPVRMEPETLAGARRRWIRRVAAYAAVAILAAVTAILFARTRYERFVPPRPPAGPSAPHR